MAELFNISNILKIRRKELALTKDRMSKFLGISFSVYASYEEGRACPRIDRMLMIAHKLGHTGLDDFLMLKKGKTSKLEERYLKASIEKRKIVNLILGIK